jgi:hypothetical protein
MTVWSKNEPRFTAANTPAGMPISTASVMAQSESSIVAGNSVKNSCSTGRRVTIDWPKSPVRMPNR